MIIYLAGPLDNLTDAREALGWRDKLLGQCDNRTVLISPQHAILLTSRFMGRDVWKVCRSMVATSDAVLAHLDGGFPFGTIREIEYAKSLGKPVAVSSSKEILSLAASDLLVYNTPEKALAGLVQFVRERRQGWKQ